MTGAAFGIVGSSAQVDERELALRIVDATEMRRRLDEDDFHGRPHMGLEQVPAMRRRIAFSDHDMSVHLRLTVVDRDGSGKRQYFDLLADRNTICAGGGRVARCALAALCRSRRRGSTDPPDALARRPRHGCRSLRDPPAAGNARARDLGYGGSVPESRVRGALCQRPDVPLERIKGGKHFTPEDHPERIVAALRSLIDEVIGNF